MVRRAFARHLQSLADTGTRSGPLSGPSARPGRRFVTSATIILTGTGGHAATCEIVKSHCSRPTIWQFMRDNWLSNRVFTSHDNIVDHCCEAWNKLIDQPWRIMIIGRRQWTRGP
jgi:hypothetical protein